jgi:fatty acid desaturase
MPTRKDPSTVASTTPRTLSPITSARFEWQTWLVILAVYGSWLGLVLGYRDLPLWFSWPALVIVTAWFMSLQHELLHGHPTPNKAFNRLLGLAPLSAWYPYDIYRDSHLDHHRDQLLTTPGLDPESNYVQAEVYARMNGWQRLRSWALRTVVGRFLVGPGVTIPAVWSDLFADVRKRGWAWVNTWVVHLAWLVLMLWWLYTACGVHPAFYLIGVAYPALGLAMLRSFNEHRPAAAPQQRTVVNEAAWPWRLLFLNNNFHAVHHDMPSLAWYLIPAVYRSNRDAYLDGNGHYLMPGYCHVIARYAFKPVDSPIHPGCGHEVAPP